MSRSLLKYLLLLTLALGIEGRIGFECESAVMDVTQDLSDSSFLHRAFAQGVRKGVPILRGADVGGGVGFAWELQADERMGDDGKLAGFNGELVIPPQNGFPSRTTQDIRQFCLLMQHWQTQWDGFCKELVDSHGTHDTHIKGTVLQAPVTITAQLQNSRMRFPCIPQMTISMPPANLWCFLLETAAEARTGLHVHPITWENLATSQRINQHLQAVDALNLSPAAKLLVYFIGRMTAIAQSFKKPEPYPKSIVGSVLSRSSLSDIWTHALSAHDRTVLTTAGATSLDHHVQTIFNGRLGEVMFPAGWAANRHPSLTVQEYLDGIKQGRDRIRLDFGTQFESFSATPFQAGGTWLVEFRGVTTQYGGKGVKTDRMDRFRNAMMHLFQQVQHYESSVVQDAETAHTACPGMAAVTGGTNGVKPELDIAFTNPSNEWATCVNLPKFQHCE